MFGRRKREEQAGEEAAREAERRALFEELARRPDTVCPFLGLAEERAGYRPEPNSEHRCYAFGDPAPLSDEQQRHVCLERGYSNCPRYLRGVLVIPTEELEALRRPHPPVAPPPPPPPAAAESGGRGRWFLVVPLLLLLLIAAGGGGWYLLNNNRGIAIGPSTTPTATPTEQQPSAIPTPSGTPSATTSGSGLATPTPLPTPTQGDKFLYYEVTVGPGHNYTLFRVNGSGRITDSQGASFNNFSHAQVARIKAPNGLLHWRTLNGGLTGLSYIEGRSGPFGIRKVYRASDGSLHATILPKDQL